MQKLSDTQREDAAKLSESSIIAECWTCGHKCCPGQGLPRLVRAERYAGSRLDEIAECCAAGHDVREVNRD